MKQRLNKKAGFKPAFTMIELVFVIVVLGILAAVAIPKLAASRDDAILVKGKSQVSAIRSGIAMLKSKNLLEGNNNSGNGFYPQSLDKNASPSTLFSDADDNSSVLEYGLENIANKDGKWNKVSTNNNGPTINYTFHLNNTDVNFYYDKTNGKFYCTPTTDQNCKDLTQ